MEPHEIDHLIQLENLRVVWAEDHPGLDGRHREPIRAPPEFDFAGEFANAVVRYGSK